MHYSTRKETDVLNSSQNLLLLRKKKKDRSSTLRDTVQSISCIFTG